MAEYRSEELVPVFGRGHLMERYRNNNQALTTVFRMPSSGLYYLAIRPEYFRKELCPSMGFLKDCYIGRCKPRSTLFGEIGQNKLVHDETSDNEFDGIEEEDLVGQEEGRAVS